MIKRTTIPAWDDQKRQMSSEGGEGRVKRRRMRRMTGNGYGDGGNADGVEEQWGRVDVKEKVRQELMAIARKCHVSLSVFL